MKRFLPILLASPTLFTVSIAALSMLDIAGQCADSSGFNTCWNQALGNAQTCYQTKCQGQGTCSSENDCTSSNPDCVQACSCVAYEEMIQCALTSCWNMVASCQYQNLAISAVEYCPVALGKNNPFIGTDRGWVWIPYFPSNPSRPSGCSCDIAYVYLEQRASVNEHTACYNNANAQTAYIDACDCCQASLAVSTFYNMCPNTDPAAVASYMPYFPYNSVANGAKCASVIMGTDCHSYGFDLPNYNTSLTTTYYAAGNVPPNGTETISNTPGEITSPPFPTITWQLGEGLGTYTAIAVTTGSPAGGSSAAAGSGSSSGAAVGSGSTATVATIGSTATSAVASAVTSKSGAVGRHVCNAAIGWGFLGTIVGLLI